MNGILPLWKERGMTSFDCVFQLRKILKTKKVGHTGTLDPEVDGVLPICIGRATKAAEFMVESGKAYRGEITLGYSTETEDAHGSIVEEQAVLQPLSTEAIDAAMGLFLGTITQIPPMYSAVKVNGRRLYEYARKGVAVERPSRQANIESFVRISEPVYDETRQSQSWEFEVICGKGTYIRTLAVDLGAKLGYPAHMSRLTRIQSGPFVESDCVTLDEVRAKMEAGEIDSFLRPVEMVFTDLPRIDINDEQWIQVKNGAVLDVQDWSILRDYRESGVVAFYYEGGMVALYQPHPKKTNLWKPRKMFLP